MNLRTCKKIMNLIYVVAIIFLVVGVMAGGQSRGIYLGIALLLALAYTVFTFRFWRCPKCGAVLAKGKYIKCDKCGWEMPLGQ